MEIPVYIYGYLVLQGQTKGPRETSGYYVYNEIWMAVFGGSAIYGERIILIIISNSKGPLL